MSTNAPRVLLRSEDSGGEVAVIEVGGGARPPLHHHDFDEAFYVLEGELTFRLRDELFTRKAGELAFAPRGVPHTYANLSGANARALIVCTPAGFERYFDRIAARIAGVEPPPEASKPIPEVTTVGPAIGAATTREEKQNMGLGTYKVRASAAVSDMAMAADSTRASSDSRRVRVRPTRAGSMSAEATHRCTSMSPRLTPARRPRRWRPGSGVPALRRSRAEDRREGDP
jgi:quercetin dioxygenase-like cupin family protein